MKALAQSETGSFPRAGSEAATPQGVELRHLRYFVAVADAGTFTHAAARMYIAQPTLSQQIRRLEEMVGTPLLRRRREGVRLTEAGVVLLEESRVVLSLIDRGVCRTREAAGIGRPRLRFIVPPHLPEALMVETVSRLRSTAVGAEVDVAWIELPLDGEFSAIQQRRADAGLGWVNPEPAAFPAHLEVMNLGEWEPVAWIPAAHPAVPRGTIGLGELAQMEVVHGPRRLSTATYDAWLAVLRTANPRFDFTDPPFRNSLSMTLAFAAAGSRPAAVLTGPRQRTRAGTAQTGPFPASDTYGMIPVHVDQHPLTATAGLVWGADLARQLQQVLVDVAMAALWRRAVPEGRAQFGTGVYAELGVDPVEVRADGPVRQVQPGADVAVRQALGGELSDLEFLR
jgi:DNA-binding transcriptional LysR family regulator